MQFIVNKSAIFELGQALSGRKPKIAFMVFTNAAHPIGGHAIFRVEAGKFAILEAGQSSSTSSGAYPKIAFPVFVKGRYLVVDQPLRNCVVRKDLTVAKLLQAVAGSDPQRASMVLNNCGNLIGCTVASEFINGYMSVVQPAQAIIRAYPDISVTSLT